MAFAREQEGWIREALARLPQAGVVGHGSAIPVEGRLLQVVPGPGRLVRIEGDALVVPGDPASFMLGTGAQPDTLAALRQQMGLDLPWPTRYARWLGGVLTGDLGTSLAYKAPVAGMILDRVQVSLPLALMALALAVAVALPVGMLAASRRGRPADARPHAQCGQRLTSLHRRPLRRVMQHTHRRDHIIRKKCAKRMHWVLQRTPFQRGGSYITLIPTRTAPGHLGHDPRMFDGDRTCTAGYDDYEHPSCFRRRRPGPARSAGPPNSGSGW